MGGFGAIKFAVKFPEFFKAGLSLDGAFNDWEMINKRHPDLVEEIFNNDEDLFNEYSPMHWIAMNSELIKNNNVHLRIVKALLQPHWLIINKSLSDVDLNYEKKETSCKHDLGCILEEDGRDSIAFLLKDSN